VALVVKNPPANVGDQSKRDDTLENKE
jgi:hypothetical protein